MQTLSLIKPDDWHLHLRDSSYLKRTVNDTARQFARAIVMPNLSPPITTVQQAQDYRKRILMNLNQGNLFQPLMTLYLTDGITLDTIQKARHDNHIYACKFYPAGATTHSAQGITNIKKLYPIFEAMQKQGLPLLLHGEVTDPDVDIFDREARFIEQYLQDIVQEFQSLKIVMEHITTQEAVEFVKATPKNVGATITAHHLLYHRNALFQGGINPHFYCLPMLKRKNHQESLIKAATSGNSKFFLGTDSAPHAISQKEKCQGCAGIYTAHAAIEFYAEAFEKANALEKLEKFASFNGAQFYGLPVNSERIELIKETHEIPEELSFGDSNLKPLRAKETISWKLVESRSI